MPNKSRSKANEPKAQESDMVTVEERNALVEAAYRSYQEIRKDGIGLEALETWWRLYYLKLGHKALGRIVGRLAPGEAAEGQR